MNHSVACFRKPGIHSCLGSAGKLALALAIALVCGCRKDAVSSSQPAATRQKLPGFVEAASEVGLRFQMHFLPNEQGQTFKINLYDHGCGVTIGDYDGDGDDDVYLLNQLGPNGLFRNRGDGTFEDVTAEVGVGLDDRISVGATFVDYDNDGDQDLFVTSTRGGNVLFQNEGQGRYSDVTAAARLEHVGHSQTVAFFDYDNDGWLDLYLLQTAEWTKDAYDPAAHYYVGKGELGNFGDVLASKPEFNILYRNNRDGTFTDVTELSGLKGRGWAGDVAVLDYDEDGWPDVLVTCMFGRAQLYHNQGNGTFEDVTLQTLGRTPFGGIGAKALDFDNDGRLDLYIVDMHSDMWMGVDFDHASLELAQQNEHRRFDHFFGPYYDEDERFRREEYQVQDLLGFRREEVLFGNAFYRNRGDGTFEECSSRHRLETFWPWGIASGDFDNNGFVDLFVPSGMGYPFYYWPNALLMNYEHGEFSDRSGEFGIEPPAAGEFLRQQLGGQPSARSSRCAAVADFNSDGQLDLIVNNFNHEPYLFQNRFPRQNYIAFRLLGTQSNRDAIGALVTLQLSDKRMVRQVEPAGGYLSQSTKTLHFGLGKVEAIDKIEIRWPSGHRQSLEHMDLNRLHVVVEPGSDR